MACPQPQPISYYDVLRRLEEDEKALDEAWRNRCRARQAREQEEEHAKVRVEEQKAVQEAERRQAIQKKNQEDTQRLFDQIMMQREDIAGENLRSQTWLEYFDMLQWRRLRALEGEEEAGRARKRRR